MVSLDVAGVSTSGDDDDPAMPNDAALLAMFSTSTAFPVGSSVNSATASWFFNSTPEAFNFLAVGEELVLTYTLVAFDGLESGLRNIAITIEGTNDGPMIVVEPDDTTSASFFRDEIGRSELTPLFATSDLTLKDLDTSACASRFARLFSCA